MEKLITWEMTNWRPETNERLLEVQTEFVEDMQKELKNRRFSAFGVSASGETGYAITDLSETDILKNISRYRPHLRFNVETMMTAEQCLTTLKAAKRR